MTDRNVQTNKCPIADLSNHGKLVTITYPTASILSEGDTQFVKVIIRNIPAARYIKLGIAKLIKLMMSVPSPNFSQVGDPQIK